MRYGYQDMPNGYIDVDPDKEEPMTTSPICLNCGSPQDFECNICNDCPPASAPAEPTGTQILAYARNVYGKPWRMDADTATAIDEYLETGDIPHRAPFLLAQLIDDVVSLLTWRVAS